MKINQTNVMHNGIQFTKYTSNHVVKILTRSFSLQKANKKLFSPLNDRVLIVEALFVFYLLWVAIGLNYASMLGNGMVGYKNIFNSFVIRVLTDVQYFWLRTTYPRDSIGLLWYVYKHFCLRTN